MFDNKEHVRFATLPGMWDRTVTVGSAGSTSSLRCSCALSHQRPAEMFAATGWRVGWLIAPEWIISPTLAASTRIVFCSNSPMQEAVASGLEEAKKRRFFEIQLEEYTERRAILAEAFDRLGVRYTFPEGTYFMLLVSSQGPHCAGRFLTALSGRVKSYMAGGLRVPRVCAG